MNDEQVYIVDELKQKIFALVEKIKNQKSEIVNLVTENDDLSNKLTEQEKEITELQKQNNTLKLSKAFGSHDGESQEAKLQINKIVREIDKCIALLNR